MIEMMNLGEDDYGPFTRVRVKLGDQARVIRWGLDNYTYLSLKKCLIRFRTWNGLNKDLNSDLPGPSLIQLSRDYEWHPVNNHFVSHMMTVSESGSDEAAFSCSDLYVANLQWLKNVSTIDELGVMRAELSALSATDTVEVHRPKRDGTLTLRPVPKRQAYSGKKAVLLTFAGAAGVAGALFGVHMSMVFRSHVTAPLHVTVPNSSGHTLPSPSAKQKQPDPVKVSPDTTIWDVPPGEVALTFDNGPSAYTIQILNILKKYDVHATFFFVGEQMKYWPKGVVAVARAGDEIGDLSMTHPVLPSLSAAEQKDQILETSQLIERLTGESVTLFRPPYGVHSMTTDNIAFRADMSVVMWNRDPRDWAAKSPASVIHSVLDTVPSGGIYALSEKPNTVKALPTIIQNLKSEHLRFVVIPHTANGKR
jgi:peptidoglycan/xylan/chitin deacetylase (PgdA/CDA1 family)